MNKIILLGSALCVLAGSSAQAQISVTLGEPVYATPVYAAPAYVNQGYVVAPAWPSQHYDIHRHRHNDYWAARQQEERDHGDRGHR